MQQATRAGDPATAIVRCQQGVHLWLMARQAKHRKPAECLSLPPKHAVVTARGPYLAGDYLRQTQHRSVTQALLLPQPEHGLAPDPIQAAFRPHPELALTVDEHRADGVVQQPPADSE